MDIDFADINLDNLFGDTTDTPANEPAGDTVEDTAPEDTAPEGTDAATDTAAAEDPDTAETDGDDEGADGEEADATDDEDPDADPDPDNEGDGETGEAIDVTSDTTVRLPDGTELTGAELEKSILLHADYTRKRQQDTAKVKEIETQLDQVKSWYEERVTDPSAWIHEILTESGQATQLLTHVIVDAVAKGAVDQRIGEKFLEAFDLDENELGQLANANARDRELAAYKRREQLAADTEKARQENAAANEANDALVAEYQRTLETLKTQHGLSDSELFSVLEFADERDILDLTDAYDLWAVRNAKKPAADPAKVERGKQLIEKKRKAAAVTPASSARGVKKPAAGRSLEDDLSATFDRIFS